MDTETYGRRALLPSSGANPGKTFTDVQSSTPQATDPLVRTDDNDHTGLSRKRSPVCRWYEPTFSHERA